MFHVFTIIISQNIWTIKFSYLTLLLFYFLELKLLGLRKSKWQQKWLYSNSHETGMMSMINKMQILVLTVMRLEWCHIDWFQYQPVMLYWSTTVHPNLGFFFFFAQFRLQTNIGCWYVNWCLEINKWPATLMKCHKWPATLIRDLLLMEAN